MKDALLRSVTLFMSDPLPSPMAAKIINPKAIALTLSGIEDDMIVL